MFQIIDYLIIAVFLLLTLFIAFRNRKFSQKDTANFFLGGRNQTWWLAGISMVATTFAADTPLAFTEIVAENGISGSWIVWNMLIGGMLTAVFFAGWWRKSDVSTDNELIELRYSGKPATFLRGFKAIYLGIFINVLIIGWVNVAMISIFQVLFDMSWKSAFVLTLITMIFTAIYTAIGGLKSVIITDSIQFIIAMAACIILAYLVINSEIIGGIEKLKYALPKESIQFLPKIGIDGLQGSVYGLSLGALFARIGMQWWASYYPGAEPGGGGYIAQRILSTKSEKDAVKSVVLFQILNYCIRPWPWIIVALSTIVLYPNLTIETHRFGYLYAVNTFMPTGLKGLMFVAFLAAYMSTISSQLNWGASYLVSDIYKRFIAKTPNSKKEIQVSMFSTLLIMFLGAFITTLINSISGVWSFVIECGAGMGMVSILRWFWWRINAKVEIVASIVPFVVYAILKLIPIISPNETMAQWLIFPNSYFLIVLITTISWLITLYLTKPESKKTLDTFFEKIEPLGFWHRKTNHQLLINKLIIWILSVVLAFFILFFVGFLLLNEIDKLIYSLIALLIVVYPLVRNINKLGKAKKET